MNQLCLFKTDAPKPTPPNRATGAMLAEQGAAAAAEHADAESPNWQDDALEMVRVFFAQFNEGMVEDVRAFAESRGFTQPPSKRAWGAVICKAARLGIVKKNGFRSVKNPKAHKTPATLWARAA